MHFLLCCPAFSEKMRGFKGDLNTAASHTNFSGLVLAATSALAATYIGFRSALQNALINGLRRGSLLYREALRQTL